MVVRIVRLCVAPAPAVGRTRQRPSYLTGVPVVLAQKTTLRHRVGLDLTMCNQLKSRGLLTAFVPQKMPGMTKITFDATGGAARGPHDLPGRSWWGTSP
jgi:hypothetical protein